MKRLLLLLLLTIVGSNIQARRTAKEFYNDNKKVLTGAGIVVGAASGVVLLFAGYRYAPHIYNRLYVKRMFNKYQISCDRDSVDYPKASSFIIISRKEGLKGLRDYVTRHKKFDDLKDLCNSTNLVKVLADINRVESQQIVDIYLKK